MGYEGFSTYSEHTILILLGLGMQMLNLKQLKCVIYDFYIIKTNTIGILRIKKIGF